VAGGDAPDLIVVGERAALGPLRRDLLPAYARWANSVGVRRGTGMQGVWTLEAEEDWYERAIADSAQPSPPTVFFTVHDARDGAPVGTASLFTIGYRGGRASYSIMLGERRGEGIGTDATRLVLDFGFTVLGLRNVLLEAYADNLGALRAYERAGFREIGRRRGASFQFGRRLDTVLMDAVPEDFEGSVLAAREET